MITRKLELDITQNQELNKAFELASKYCLRALVVPGHLVVQLNLMRLTRGFGGKVITPINPKGDMFGSAKFTDLPVAAFDADGYEITLSHNRSIGEIFTEISETTKFVKNYLGDRKEIRYVLGTQTRAEDQIIEICDYFKNITLPSLLRTDNCHKPQVSKSNPKFNNLLIDKIKTVSQLPIKICGNINDIQTIESSNAKYFGVNPQQLSYIITQMENLEKTQTEQAEVEEIQPSP